MTVSSITPPGGDDVNALVLDVGSSHFRAGFSGEDLPRVVEPSTFMFSSDNDVDMSGSSRNPQRSPINLLSAGHGGRMQSAIITDSKASAIDIDTTVLEQIIQYSFTNPSKSLSVNLSDSPLIMTEPNKASMKYRRACFDTAFETFDFPAVSLLKRATGTAFSAGKQSGLVVDIGASMTSVTPVFDGFVLQKPSAEYFGIGGDMLDTILDELLKKKRVTVVPFFKRTEGVDAKYLNAARLATVRELKHEVCNMSTASLSSVTGYANWHLTLQGEGASAPAVLPDGTSIDLAPFHQVLPELLFDPTPIQAIPQMSHLAQGFHGIGAAALEVISNCDIDARKSISSDVILTGGSSLFAHMPERLLKYLQTPEGPSAKAAWSIPIPKAKVTASPVSIDRTCTSWLGCSIAASCATFQQLWISKRPYEEDGLDRVVHRQLLW